MLEAVRVANLGLRFALELSALAALAYWGAQAARPLAGRVALAVLAPLVAAVVWGVFVSPKAPIGNEVVRALGEAAVFGAAALGLVLAGRPAWGATFAALALVSGVLLRFTGG